MTAKTKDPIAPGKERDDSLMLWMDRFVEEHRYAPSMREIGEEFGLSSTDTIWRWLERLRREGRITWVTGQVRTIATVKP